MTPSLASASPSTQHHAVSVPLCELMRMQSFRPARNPLRLVLLPLQRIQFVCPSPSVPQLRSYEVWILRCIHYKI